MGRPPHPLRARALYLMRAGLATPLEIARAIGVSRLLVMNWRARAGIDTGTARLARVRRLLNRGNGHEHESGAGAAEAMPADSEAIDPL